jgi:hypothetical protein
MLIAYLFRNVYLALSSLYLHIHHYLCKTYSCISNYHQNVYLVYILNLYPALSSQNVSIIIIEIISNIIFEIYIYINIYIYSIILGIYIYIYIVSSLQYICRIVLATYHTYHNPLSLFYHYPCNIGLNTSYMALSSNLRLGLK